MGKAALNTIGTTKPCAEVSQLFHERMRIRSNKSAFVANMNSDLSPGAQKVRAVRIRFI